jgi:hypothetical protein
MKKIILLFLFFGSLLTSAYAQDPYTTVFSGMRVGFNVTNIPTAQKVDTVTVNDNLYDSVFVRVPNRARFGFHAGFFVQKQFNERIGIRADLLYSESGGSYQLLINKFERHSLRYLDFQPALIFNVAPSSSFNRFFITAAPAVRLLANVNVQRIEGDLSRSYTTLDYGGVLGATYMIRISRYAWMTLDARSHYGFRNIVRYDSDVLRKRNQGMQYSVGFAIPIK